MKVGDKSNKTSREPEMILHHKRLQWFLRWKFHTKTFALLYRRVSLFSEKKDKPNPGDQLLRRKGKEDYKDKTIEVQ